MRRALLTPLVVLVLVLGVVGCSGDDGDPGSTTTAAPATAARVRAVSQNLLHGAACPAGTDSCLLPDRVALFVRQLAEAGCPELVGVQEANERMVTLLADRVQDVCDGAYDVVWDASPGIDREVVLTTLPVLGSRRERLAGPLRTALWVRVAADVGIVDFVTTHLASSSDDQPCTNDLCPAPCEAADMLNACQARQVAALAHEVATPDSVVIVGGDLNARPGEPTLAVLTGAGFADSHLAAGNPECDPTTGVSCTSGRDDASVASLSDPASRNDERIDDLLWGGDRSCRPVTPTGPFNPDPATGGPSGLVWPSDHTGVEATLECATTATQRDAAPDATVPSGSATTGVTDGGGGGDADAVTAITTAYETFFDGAITDLDQRVSYVQDGEDLKPFVAETFERTKDLAVRSKARVDAVRLLDAGTADVSYSILIDGTVVLGDVQGDAVKVDDRWLIGRRTVCAIATQGAETVPEVCR